MATPDWFTAEYLRGALAAFHKESNVQIDRIKIAPAVGKGENFGGVLTRAVVDYRQGSARMQKHLIVKHSFEDDEFSRHKMEPYDIFKREISLYQRVLPRLQQLLRDISDPDELFAQHIYTDYRREAMIFEDLAERGYVMADRTKGLDIPHIRLILRKLAKMHATSAVLNESCNRFLEDYDRGFFNEYTNNYSSYFVGSLVACGKFLTERCPDYREYGEMLLALEPHYMAIGKRCFRPTPGHVNVLVHGDMWTNNVMFKYDSASGEPVDVLIIDFQYTFWGSPTLDLHHFFNTSLQEEIRLHGQDELIQYYHKIFTHTLQKLRYKSNPIPSLRLFRLQAEEKRFFAFHSSCVIQPVMLNEEAADADFQALMGDDERALRFKSRVYENEKVIRNVKNLLPVFARRGLLDINQVD